MTENLDPNKMYLEWSGSSFPNSLSATFKAPAGSTIDWGDGTVETFDTDSPQVNTHTYTDELTEHTIAISGLTNIGNEAFRQCTSLTSLEIPDSVTSIGVKAFSNCDSLTSVYITDIASWCNISFGGYEANPLCYAKNLYLNNELITELVIPDSVTSIGSWAFQNYSSLTSVVVPDSVTSIGNFAFQGCSSLLSVAIGNGVTSIGRYAFDGCSNLTSVVIGNSVTAIDEYAFYACSSLTSVYYKGTASEWSAISFNLFGNDLLKNATRYYYSETEPALNAEGTAYNGNYWHYDTQGTIVVWAYSEQS